MAIETKPALGSVEHLLTITRREVPKGVGCLAALQEVLADWQVSESFAATIKDNTPPVLEDGHCDPVSSRSLYLGGLNARIDVGYGDRHGEYDGKAVRVYRRQDTPPSGIGSRHYNLEIPVNDDDTINRETVPPNTWHAQLWTPPYEIAYSYSNGSNEPGRPSDFLWVLQDAAYDLASSLTVRRQVLDAEAATQEAAARAQANRESL